MATNTPRATIAETIADALVHDGSTWRTRDGVTMDDLIGQHGGTISWRDGWHVGDTWRADFRDGSAITSAGGWWDIGYPDCFCWAGIGHGQYCTAGRDHSRALARANID